MRADPELIRQIQKLTGETLHRDSVEHGSTLRTVTLNDIRLHAVTESQCIRHILASLANGRGGWVVTPNLDHLRRASREEAFRAILAEADLVVPDGMPLVWASRLQGTPLPERVAGSSLTQTLSEAAALRGHSMFLIGGAPGAAKQATAILRERFPGLPVVGHHGAPPGFDHDPTQVDELLQSLHASKPAIILVALGSPKQEMLIQRFRHERPDAWWLGVGISFSFVAGHVKRAPRWMQRAGLEWTHRLVQEPRRLARRYLVDGPPFALSLFYRAAVRRCLNTVAGKSSACDLQGRSKAA